MSTDEMVLAELERISSRLDQLEGRQLVNKPRTVAQRIDRSVSFVYEEMAAGRIPYVIVSKTRMVLEDDLRRYVRSLRDA